MSQTLTILFYYIFLFALVFFCVNYFLAPSGRRLASTHGWVDDPSKGDRKLHRKPTPYLGGAVIYGGVLAGLIVFLIFFQSFWPEVEMPPWSYAYIVGAGLILAIGTLDDVFDISAKRKLLAQIFVAILVFLGGVKLDHIVLPWIGMVELGQLSAPATVLVIVFVMNAINIIDGLDGLACSVALVATVANGLLAWHLNQPVVMLLSIIVAASMAGFLMHNFYPAKMFLGDGGSLLLGYLIACLGIQNIQASGNVAETLVPVLAVIYPILDILVAMLRRLIRGKPIMSADKAHIHHRLLGRGMSQPRVVFTVVGISVMAVIAAVLSMWELYALAAIMVTIFMGMMFIGMLVLNYLNPANFHFTMKMRPVFKKHNAYKQLIGVRMKYATSEDELLELISDAGREYGLARLVWKNNGSTSILTDNSVAAAGGLGGRVRNVEMGKCGGAIEYTIPLDMDNDLQVEIDTLMRSLVNSMDKAIKRLRRSSKHGQAAVVLDPGRQEAPS